MCPRNADLVAGRGGVYARHEVWIWLRCLTGDARRVCVSRVARVRSRLKERQAGAVPRHRSPGPRKDAMPVSPRSVPDASEFVLDEMGLEVALDRVLMSAKELTGARYAALCVLNDARDGSPCC